MLLTKEIGTLLFFLFDKFPLLIDVVAKDFLHACSSQLTKAYQTANVLFEVLKAVTQQHSVEVDDEV